MYRILTGFYYACGYTTWIPDSNKMTQKFMQSVKLLLSLASLPINPVIINYVWCACQTSVLLLKGLLTADCNKVFILSDGFFFVFSSCRVVVFETGFVVFAISAFLCTALCAWLSVCSHHLEMRTNPGKDELERQYGSFWLFTKMKEDGTLIKWKMREFSYCRCLPLEKTLSFTGNID